MCEGGRPMPKECRLERERGTVEGFLPWSVGRTEKYAGDWTYLRVAGAWRSWRFGVEEEVGFVDARRKCFVNLVKRVNLQHCTNF